MNKWRQFNEKKTTGLHESGSVFKPLIMVLRLDMGEVSMTGMYDVANFEI